MKNKWRALARIFGVLGNVIFIIMLIIMSSLVFFLVQSKVAGKPPGVAGYQMLIVISGSMNPAFDTGSVVFVRPLDPKDIVVGDILTFKGSGGSDNLTTHRVVDVHTEDGIAFTTRGDANNVDDPNRLPAQNVVGKVFLAIPYAGYLFNYVQTKEGLIALILIPGALIICTELFKLYNYARQLDKQKESTGNMKQGLVTGKQQEEMVAAPLSVSQAANSHETGRVEEVPVKEKIAAAANKRTAGAEPAVLNKAAVIDETDAKTMKSMIMQEFGAVKEYPFEPAVIDEIYVPDMIVAKKEIAAVSAAHLYNNYANRESVGSFLDVERPVAPARRKSLSSPAPTRRAELRSGTERKLYRYGDEDSREKVWKERAFAILSGLPVVVDDDGEEKVWKERAFAMLSGLAVVVDDTGKEEVS